MKNFLILPACILFCIHTVFSQAGSLDNSFSGDGKITLLVGDSSSTANAIAIQQDGKILVAGILYSALHKNNDFLIVRFNTDGTLDKSFASTGARGIDFGGDDRAYSVIVQPDGKIAVFGHSFHSHHTEYVIAARLQTNGKLDSTFGVNGEVMIPFTSYNNELIYAAAIQADGKFVMAGDYFTGAELSDRFALIRLNSNGTLDNTFGTNGEVFTFASNYQAYVLSYALSVAIQPDGRIVAGGRVDTSNKSMFAIVRYKSNGTLDSAFGGDGIVNKSVGTNNAFAFGTGVAIQPDGKILQAGRAGGFAVLRYNSNGSLDKTFSGNGKAVFSAGGLTSANSIALQTDGKIILAGTANTGNGDVALIRVNSDGTQDNFGSFGIVTTNFGGNDVGNAVAIQADGKIVVAGSRNGNRIIVARYLATGSPLTASVEKITTEIKSANADVLAQNFPNPFSNTTTINYSLPQSRIGGTSAKIIVTDKNGNALKQFSVSQNKGSITVDASTLSSGAYQYSLYVDGRLIASKQMILSK